MFKNKIKNEPTIWTKNYTIMTLGSVISLMGNYIVSFILGILILEESDSVFLYGLYWSVYYAVKIISPVLCGSIIDRLSKQKIIYLFDFLSAGVFLLVWIILGRSELSYPIFFAVSVYLGFSDCCYNVAFYSLYPSLVREDQLQKAYSIYSMLNTSAGIAVPIGTLLYSFLGIRSIFFAAALLYFTAAVFEMFPKLNESTEKTVKTENQSFLKGSLRSFKDGFTYINGSKVLLFMAVLVMIRMFASYIDTTLLLPFCRERWENSYFWYIVITGAFASGYFMGGLINSRFYLLSKNQYEKFILLFFGIVAAGGICYFLPRVGMIVIQYLLGLMISTQYTLRMSAIQINLNEEYRGRYCGIATSLNNMGMVAGTFLSGCLAEFIPIQYVVLGGYSTLFLALIFIIGLKGGEIKLFFNHNE